MNETWKRVLLVGGFLTALLLVGQLVMGQLILGGRVDLIKAHQHSGYLTMAISLLYVAGSLRAILGMPTRTR